MKIQELENELNISRANIRFYEKEGLLNPARKENGYRDYSDDDIAILKKIIVYRKLGISVTDIKKIFANELELQDAISQSIEDLQKEIERLNGSIELCKEIQKDNPDNNSFDEEHYWEEINSNEAKGNKFVDICKDYMEFEKDVLFSITDFYFPIFKYFLPDNLSKKQKIIRFSLAFFGICIVWGIIGLFFSDFTSLKGFIEPIIAFIQVSIFTLPHFLLKRKYPKLASVYIKILGIVTAVALICAFIYSFYGFYLLFSM